MVYDSLNQRIYWRISRNIKDVGEVVYLKAMFLLKSSTATVTCIFPENDFNKYENRFSLIVKSANIISYVQYLAKERISNFKPIDFEKQYFTWREAIGFCVWVVVIIVFVRMKNSTKKKELQETEINNS